MPARASTVIAFALLFGLAALATPPPQGARAAGCGPLAAPGLCGDPAHSAMLAHALALRANSALHAQTGFTVHLLLSSPIPSVDLTPAWRFLGWWIEEANKAMIARASLQ